MRKKTSDHWDEQLGLNKFIDTSKIDDVIYWYDNPSLKMYGNTLYISLLNDEHKRTGAVYLKLAEKSKEKTNLNDLDEDEFQLFLFLSNKDTNNFIDTVFSTEYSKNVALKVKELNEEYWCKYHKASLDRSVHTFKEKVKRLRDDRPKKLPRLSQRGFDAVCSEYNGIKLTEKQ